MPSVLIVEGHPIFREGIKEVLSHEPEFRPVGEAGSAREAWEQLRNGNWDAVVLDISLPDKSGLDFLAELKQLRPRLPKLVVSVHPEDQYATRTIKAGAWGYLSKDRAAEELVKALTKIVHGEKYVSSSVASKLVRDLDNSDRAPHERLSKRETEVLKLITAGKPPRIIAKELSVSTRTVNTYRARILQKFDVKSNAELIQYVLQNNLLED